MRRADCEQMPESSRDKRHDLDELSDDTSDVKVPSAQSRNFQVSAPSKCRMTTESRSAGSKFRRFTPWRAPGVGSSGSQCVATPQVLHRKFLSVRSPQTYSSVFSGWPWMDTEPSS